MASKKTQFRNKVKKPHVQNLEAIDVLCPICRTILIEPVTLPCNHAFCKLCFDGTMENANLVCPLCRVRVSSWLRKAKKGGNLVDQTFWNAIKKHYPKEVQNKYKGIDNIIEEEKPLILLAAPGEIFKEYELQKKREVEEMKNIHEAEEKASIALIKQIKQEEEYRKQIEEQKLRLDEELAKKLSGELSSSSRISPKKSSVNQTKRKSGPMDKFIRSDCFKINKFPQSKSRNELQINNHMKEKKTISPNNFATKPYTCQVLCVDKHPTNKANHSVYKHSYTSVVPKTQNKIQQISSIVDAKERKSTCKSECKSNGSGDNSDIIDQECRFYFKPIDAQKKYHVPGSLPLKIPFIKEKALEVAQIMPPSGSVVNLHLRNVISAFASFSLVLQKRQTNKHERQSSDTNQSVIEEKSLVEKQYCILKEPEEKSEPYCNFKQENNTTKTCNKESEFHGFSGLDVDRSIKTYNILLEHLVKLGEKTNDKFPGKINLNTFKHKSFPKVSGTIRVSGIVDFPKLKVDTFTYNKSNQEPTRKKENDVSALTLRNSVEICSNNLKSGRNTIDVNKNVFPLNPVQQDSQAKGRSLFGNNSFKMTGDISGLQKVVMETDDHSNIRCNSDAETSQLNVTPKKTCINFKTRELPFIGKASQQQGEYLVGKTREVPIISTRDFYSKSEVINVCNNLNTEYRKSDHVDKLSKDNMQKISPKRRKLNNSIVLNVEAQLTDSEQRKLQENLDYEFAKKLQAEFDLIQVPSKTRRGTKRQITLDEMMVM